jgi:hypothetical protein
MGAVTTLCGPVCPPLAFYQATNGSQLVASGTSAAEITKPDAAMCSGQYIVHEVNNVLYVPVTDPNQATQVGKCWHASEFTFQL